MSRTYRQGEGREARRRPASARPSSSRRSRRIQVRAVRRSEPDLARLGRAVLAIAMANAEAEAAAEQEHGASRRLEEETDGGQ